MLRTTFRALLGASALTCVFCAPTLAEHEPIVVIAAQKQQAIIEKVQQTPGGVDVVSAADFTDRLAVSLRDTLAFSPGVYTQPRFGQEVRLSIRGSGLSRGFHMRGLTLLQDGIPLNLADDNGDFQELDPLVFQHLEVYRGGNALRLGGSTLGGAINAVTPTGRTAPGYEARLDGGSFATVRAKLAAGWEDENSDGYIALTGDRSDGDRAHAHRDSLRLNSNFGWQLSEKLDTRFYASLNHIQQELPGALMAADALENPETARAGQFTQDQQRNIDSVRLQNRTTYALEKGQVEGGVFLNAKKLYHPIFQVIDYRSTDWGAFARVDQETELAGVPLAFTLGTTARLGTQQARREVNNGGHSGARTYNATQQAHTLTVYGEARAQVLEPLSVILGGIYTDGRRDVTDHMNPAQSDSIHYGTFAPKIGLLYEPLEQVQFYANYSRSTELPGFGELVQAPLAGFVPLDPQTAWTLELGSRGQQGIVAWDVSLYRAQLKDEMLQFTTNPSIPASTFNADRTLHQGVEAALDVALLPNLQLRQVYQYSDFHFQDDAQYGNNRLPVMPRHVYRAQVRWGSEALHITPSVEWIPQGAMADYNNTTRTGGYALLGLTAAAPVAHGVSVFLDARNLTGTKAIGDISAVVTANPASAIYYPVERRAVYAGVKARF